MSKKNLKTGREAFEDYYAGVFGSRWDTLARSLAGDTRQTGWSENLLEPYYLDTGSIAAARAVPPGGKNILDMCAAPGGKTLVLAGSLEPDGFLTANEFSRERRARLSAVVSRYLPPETVSRIRITGHDGSRWSRYETGCRDRMLLDVPCSSERHVLASEQHLAAWSPARIRNLVFRQWALLSGAWLVLAPAGYLVYATCALSPYENDGVVRKLLGKYSDASVLFPPEDSHPVLAHHCPERTEYGTMIMPDTSGGAGPLYFALLRKSGD
jgi:16S rRNA C967 or C1407 C5-methylase (RsmB/RsmF family)